MEIEKLDFVEAIKYLGEKYGVQIDLHQSVKENSILEPLILGTEPYNQIINVIDTIGSIKNNSISGTGGLLNN